MTLKIMLMTLTVLAVFACQAATLNCSCACCCMDFMTDECQAIYDERCIVCLQCNLSTKTPAEGHGQGRFNVSNTAEYCIAACLPFESNCSMVSVGGLEYVSWSWLPAWTWCVIIAGSSSVLLLVIVVLMVAVCRCVYRSRVRLRSRRKRAHSRLPTVSEIDACTSHSNVDLSSSASAASESLTPDREQRVNGKSRSGYRTGRVPSDAAAEQQRSPHSAELIRELSACLEQRRQHAELSPETSPVQRGRQPSYINEPRGLEDDSSDDEDDGYVQPCRGESAISHHRGLDKVDSDASIDDDLADSETTSLGRRHRHDYINVLDEMSPLSCN